MERMAAELAHMRVVGVGGGGGGMSKQMSEQWDTIVQTVQQNNMAIKEVYKSRADLQMQVSALQSQVSCRTVFVRPKMAYRYLNLPSFSIIVLVTRSVKYIEDSHLCIEGRVT